MIHGRICHLTGCLRLKRRVLGIIRKEFLECKCISPAKLHLWKPPNGKRQVSIWLAFFLCAPGMACSVYSALFQLLWWQLNDLEVKVLYRPGKGNG